MSLGDRGHTCSSKWTNTLNLVLPQAQPIEPSTPFNDYSLQEVVLFLRFLYRPATLTP